MRTAVVLLVGLTIAGTSLAQTGVTDGQWPHYHGDLGATKYSSLDQITADNVGRLEIAWRWSAANYGRSPERKYEATPIMVNGVLYTTAGLRRAAVAIDAATGETLWMYRLDEGRRGGNAPRKNSGRGVAYWSDGRGDERVLFITPGYHLIALDATTGIPVTGFGRNGIVDLKLELDAAVDTVESVIGATSPPVIVGDVAIVGAALEVGLRAPSRRNVPGHVRGYDVRTGERRWIFHTIPHPGEFGHETWLDSSWAYTGNAAVWAPFSADPELGYVYLPVEAATSDVYGGHRPGDNLFSSTLVCLDAATGKRIWHYQLVHHDIWDWDIPAAPVLVDVTVRGRRVKAVAQVTKQAYTFVFDRVTGAPLWPIVETPVPASDVPGERASPTQPIPTTPAPFDRTAMSIDELIDFTPELRAEAIELVQSYRMGHAYTPPSLAEAPDGTRGTMIMPSTTGGANWEGAAVDVETGMLYIGSFASASLLAIRSEPNVSDIAYIMAPRSMAPWTSRGPRRLPLVKPPWGRITAIDLNTGEHVWWMPNADTPPHVREHPALAGIDLGRTGVPTRAVLLVTKTLLFAGEGWEGHPVLRAHDKATGAILAEIALPAAATGLPMTYMVDGRQYIVVPVGSPDAAAELVALAVRP